MSVDCSSFDFSKDMGRFKYCHIKNQIKELHEYLNVMDEFVSKSEKEELSVLEKQFNVLPDQAKEDFWQENYPVHWEELFALNLRSSFILLLYKTVEPYIIMLCRDIGEAANSKIKIDDLKGGPYDRTRKYLEVFGCFQSPTEKEWEVVIDIYVLRNVIAHNGGMIEGSKEKRIKALMKKAPGLAMPSNGRLSIGKEFCEFALTSIERFIDELYNSAQIFYDANNPNKAN